MQPLPAERYEMCEWRSCKVAPDYHVTVDYMRYSVPFGLIGTQVDVRLTDTAVTVMSGGEAVAEHRRLRGRKGQYSTLVEHMPPAHAAMDSPWSPERFSSWAHRIGAETGAVVDRLLASRPVVEQAFVPARNILGLSKAYSPGLLERACARSNALGAVPSYTALKNAILAIRATDAGARASGRPSGADGGPVDRAKSAGRLRDADAYRRGGDREC
ncbi:Mu transposase domain-containing protein [Thermophilibacter sp.]